MALSDVGIRRLIEEGKLRIEPFDPSCLCPAGYDLRSGSERVLAPSKSALLSTFERVELPLGVAGVLHLRSSFAREGVVASLALVDPGFRGQLTFLLFNSGERTVRIGRGERLVQITFLELTQEAESGYRGSYQGSVGVVESRRGPHRRGEPTIA